MKISENQLSALAAVIREGSFERAAQVLHVTPSAISQRIKLLEEQLGAILVIRANPCTMTPTGASVYRHAVQLELLEHEVLQEIGLHSALATLPIACNADSLATFVVPALARLQDSGIQVDVNVDDESHTVNWLRSGRVLGAITSESTPVQGCRVEGLGKMTYLATATPEFAARWLDNNLSEVPALSYNRKDNLTVDFARRIAKNPLLKIPSTYLPSPEAYLEGCLLGLGWGLNPKPLVQAHLAAGRLIEPWPGQVQEVTLYWQRWSIGSATLTTISEALREAARKILVEAD